jgi:hypothetical protein
VGLLVRVFVANRSFFFWRAARTWRQGLNSSPLALMHLW